MKRLQNKPKTPKKVTKDRLNNIALYYLERFDSSVSNLRNVLFRRVNKAKYFHEDMDMGEALLWIEEVVEKMISFGYVDDERFTKNQVERLIAKGNSTKAIKSKLINKGISQDLISKYLEHFSEEFNDIDLVAAIKYLRKRRFWIYRPIEKREERKEKDMAALVRNGFSYDIVSKLFSIEDIDELEYILDSSGI